MAAAQQTRASILIVEDDPALMLPDIDGLVLCSLLKSVSDVPIIVCSATASETANTAA
jgi:hypothetical protein